MGNGSIRPEYAAGQIFTWRFGWLSWHFYGNEVKTMLLLVTYDVNTETQAGKTRLRRVAKQCVNYGRRVQNSVFECIVDNTQAIQLKEILKNIIDEKHDSLRFYTLGNNYKNKVEHIGVERGISGDDILIF